MVHVGGLKVEEVKEGRVVDGERGLRRGERRGEGSKALGEGGVGEDAGTGQGEGSREDAGGKGRCRRPELGLARCARRGGARRSGVLVAHEEWSAGCRRGEGRVGGFALNFLGPKTIRGKRSSPHLWSHDVARPRRGSTRCRLDRRSPREHGRRGRRAGYRGARGRHWGFWINYHVP